MTEDGEQKTGPFPGLASPFAWLNGKATIEKY